MLTRLQTVFLLLWMICLNTIQGYAQQTKQELNVKMAAAICPALEKAASEQKTESLTKAQYLKILTQSFGPVAGKEVMTIKRLYGADAFGNAEIMNQIGTEVGAQLMQDCPAFMALSQMVAPAPESTAATTGKSVGKLGPLQGTGLARLQVQIAKGDNAEFLWLTRFPEAEEILTKLNTLQGRQVRISWQEIDIYQPQEKRFSKMREITSIELL
ncbi:hypothetical protein KBK19_09455 [Microvirga sp. STR05]|uniref:Uncharacterized protein n=1 Tax=Hymenobacter duratus TaxID=2771356 RepID=A0ABR8JEI9_9BACT|nr:hypothetical protein [Hymenobacter duratus]MBD2715260.1 hypothetical protein [Hymenobacter duratus]MBR7950167.1 hypothetical protein [Microvirga sp. STR05]